MEPKGLLMFALIVGLLVFALSIDSTLANKKNKLNKASRKAGKSIR